MKKKINEIPLNIKWNLTKDKTNVSWLFREISRKTKWKKNSKDGKISTNATVRKKASSEKLSEFKGKT